MNYSISDLEKLSGIQSHTIRVWEKRYKILKPLRTLGNTRKYDDDQLKKLLNIAILNKSGLKISEISKLSPADLSRLIGSAEKSGNGQGQFDFIVSKILSYGFEFDERQLALLLDRFINKFGLADCYKNIMYPVLVRLGFMWLKHDICPSNEHFLVGVFRQKIMAATDAIPYVKKAKSTWLLFLPTHESHDVGLLFAKYLLKKREQKVIYLGAEVPLADINIVLKNTEVDNALLFVTKARDVDEAQEYFNKLETSCKNLPIYVAGNKDILNKIKLPSAMTWLKTVIQFEECIQNQPAL